MPGETLDELARRRAPEFFPDRPAPRAVAVEALGPRPLSEAARVVLTFDDAQRAVYVKRAADAGKEFAALGAAFKTAGGVVEPLAHFPDDGLLVTAAFAGENLNVLAAAHAKRFPWGRPGGVEGYLRACGAWLRRYQKATRAVEASRLDAPAEQAAFESSCAALERFGARPADVAALRRGHAAVLLQAAKTPFRPVAVHGDFAAWNVLAKDGEIRVLDFARAAAGPPQRDPAWFLAALDARKSACGADAGRIEALRRAFLDGYGGDIEPDALLAWIRARAASTLAASTDPDRPTAASALRRWRERRWKRSMFEHYIRQARRALEDA